MVIQNLESIGKDISPQPLGDAVVSQVYVDDLLLSGPAGNHDKFWKMITDKNVGNIRVEDPEPLDRILGRKHVTLSSKSAAALCVKPINRLYG